MDLRELYDLRLSYKHRVAMLALCFYFYTN
jgi:hypothetical protein